MTPEEAQAMLAACICTGSLFAAAVLGAERLLTGRFGVLCIDSDTLVEVVLDQVINMCAWGILFLLGTSVCSAVFLERIEAPGDGTIIVVGIGCNLVAYFGWTWLVLLYRHLAMYRGVYRRLERARIWRDASRRIDWAIGSSTHVHEIEDEYDRLQAMRNELERDYSPVRFRIRSMKFTAAMLLVRVSAALGIMVLSVKLAGGAT